ncbi:MAG: hypothetical protein WBV73_17710 [Phormidium sp.]
MQIPADTIPNVTTSVSGNCPDLSRQNDEPSLQEILLDEFSQTVGSKSQSVLGVATRIATEVERMCHKSSRIQTSGEVYSWQLILGRNRLHKCLSYYKLGTKQGRIELHSHLTAMIYRYVAPSQSQLGFQGRKNLIDDFLQDFYAASIAAFRREYELPMFQARTQLELAEYMAFTENYAKRRITLPNGTSQQLIVLRVQAFVKRQPAETSVDIEQAVETAKGEYDQQSSWSASTMQQVRSQIMTETVDPSEGMLRDRIITELLNYLESEGQSDCVNYLVLKLQDYAAPDIDEFLNLTPRERDYLQQRFKYHVDKFARASHWKLVHQWLGADLDQKLGMSSQQWQEFLNQLSPQHRELLALKKVNKFDEEIAKNLKWSLKQVQKQWMDLLELAWKYRNWDGQKLPGKKSPRPSVKNSSKVKNISLDSQLSLAVSQ